MMEILITYLNTQCNLLLTCSCPLGMNAYVMHAPLQHTGTQKAKVPLLPVHTDKAIFVTICHIYTLYNYIDNVQIYIKYRQCTTICYILTITLLLSSIFISFLYLLPVRHTCIMSELTRWTLPCMGSDVQNVRQPPQNYFSAYRKRARNSD